MKIGIYTFTAANNYGAVLQAYALKQYLVNSGMDAHCVDYKPEYLLERYRPFSCNRIKSKSFSPKYILKELLSYNKRRRKNLLFDDFKYKYLDYLSIGVDDIDYHIIGSDQVWNYGITGGDQVFLGNIPNSSGNIIAYAASMEEDLDQKYKVEFCHQLQNFKHISVRETSLQNMLLKEFNVKSELVVDPALLLDKEAWHELSKPYNRPLGKYIFLYGFNFNDADVLRIRRFSDENNLQVIIASSGVRLNKMFYNDISPENFVSLIENAEYVATNSFHGTVFSIIFGKRFLELPNKALKINKRVDNLLQMCGLSEIHHNSEYLADTDFIKLDKYPQLLVSLIEMSEKYLKNSLE